MREIKFRALDNEGTWIYSKPMPDMSFWKWVQYDSTTIFNESTGLKDKNGVEIYEGDVVTFPSKFNDFYVMHQSSRKQPQSPYITTDVHFEDGAFTFEWQFGYEGKEVNFEQVEVIGNIYENLELQKIN